MAEPRALNLEEFATINARIQAGVSRATVLDEAGIDEGAWLISQQTWLTRMAALSMGGNTALHSRYVTMLAEKEDEVARRRVSGDRRLAGSIPAIPVVRVAVLTSPVQAKQRGGSEPPVIPLPTAPAAFSRPVPPLAPPAGSTARAKTMAVPMFTGNEESLPFLPRPTSAERASGQARPEEGLEDAFVMPFAKVSASSTPPPDPLNTTMDGAPLHAGSATPFDAITGATAEATPPSQTLDEEGPAAPEALPFAKGVASVPPAPSTPEVALDAGGTVDLTELLAAHPELLGGSASVDETLEPPRGRRDAAALPFSSAPEAPESQEESVDDDLTLAMAPEDVAGLKEALAAEEVDETLSIAPMGAALPFAQAPEEAGDLRGTRVMAGLDNGALPFKATPETDAGYTPRMTLEQYAWLCSVVGRNPAQARQALAWVHLTLEDKRRLDAYFEAQMKADPSKQIAFVRALTSFSQK